MMNKRTPDHVKCVTQKFFEDQGLEPAVAAYFGGAYVHQKLEEGFETYEHVLAEVKKTAPAGAERMAEDLTKKFFMPKETYEQEAYETFKDMLAGIMSPAAVIIPVKEPLEGLLQDQENENLMMLVMSAMDDILEYMTSRLTNLIALRYDGVPMEVAEEIAEVMGNLEIIPIGIKICHLHDDDDDDDEHHHGSHCNGECGGRCGCKGKDACEETGHCQCEDGCECGNHTDK